MRWVAATVITIFCGPLGWVAALMYLSGTADERAPRIPRATGYLPPTAKEPPTAEELAAVKESTRFWNERAKYLP